MGCRVAHGNRTEYRVISRNMAVFHIGIYTDNTLENPGLGIFEKFAEFDFFLPQAIELNLCPCSPPIRIVISYILVQKT